MAIKADNAPWVIYLLMKEGAAYYVGMSIDFPRRLREHTHRHGFLPQYFILERGIGEGWAASERWWISFYRPLGIINRSDGGKGAQSVAIETRRKIAAAHTGRKRPGHGAKVSAKTKGKAHQIGAVQLASMARTQFKAGRELPPEQIEANRARIQEFNDALGPEEQRRRALDRNAKMWANRTPEQRKAIGRKIADARKRNRESVGD